jgi:hypothetical protein
MAQQPGDTHEHDDNCLCDTQLNDDELTSDADLPAAAGGIAAAHAQQAADDADGCDLDFNDATPTTDEELPCATGGVA